MTSICTRILKDSSGMVTLKSALMMGAVALGVSVLAAPVLDDVSESYAENQAFGIDRVMTGSVNESKKYIVRRSVLSETEERIDVAN